MHGHQRDGGGLTAPRTALRWRVFPRPLLGPRRLDEGILAFGLPSTLSTASTLVAEFRTQTPWDQIETEAMVTRGSGQRGPRFKGINGPSAAACVPVSLVPRP